MTLWLLALIACAAPDPDEGGPPADTVDPPTPSTPADPPPPRLRLNEVQADNESTVLGPDGVPVPWVELLHLGPGELDLGRVSLSDGGVSWPGDGVLGSGGGALAVGERLLLWADGSGRVGSLPFVVEEGETLVLSVDGVEVDRLMVEEQPDDTVVARLPDGGAWAPTARPTPGRPNGARPTDSLDPTDRLFQDDEILWMDLYLTASSEDNLRLDPRVETSGAFGWDQWFFPHAGVRLKGGWGSTRSYDQKSGFKIDLNDFDGAELLGLQRLTLNNMVQDATYIHESLTYDLFRAAGVPAPRTGWTRLFVNGELYGLMLHVETVDDQFLKRWYTDNSGPMYEGAYGTDFRVGEAWTFTLDEGEDTARDQIEEIAGIVAGPASDAAITRLETLFDLENLITVMAIEAVTLHWDGYTTSNNYRIYRDPADGRFDMIPWGTDQTFVDYWYGPWDANGLLLRFCLENIGCTRRYDDRLVEIADLIEALDLVPVARARRQLLGDAMQEDPRREFDEWTHVDLFDRTIETLRTYPDEVRASAILHRP